MYLDIFNKDNQYFDLTLLSYTSTPVSRVCFIDLDPAAVLVPVAFFFDTLLPYAYLYHASSQNLK